MVVHQGTALLRIEVGWHKTRYGKAQGHFPGALSPWKWEPGEKTSSSSIQISPQKILWFIMFLDSKPSDDEKWTGFRKRTEWVGLDFQFFESVKWLSLTKIQCVVSESKFLSHYISGWNLGVFQTLAALAVSDVNDGFLDGPGLNFLSLKKTPAFWWRKNIWLLPMFFCSAGAGAVFFLDRDEIRIIE